jgi:hypothetical protein
VRHLYLAQALLAVVAEAVLVLLRPLVAAVVAVPSLLVFRSTGHTHRAIPSLSRLVLEARRLVVEVQRRQLAALVLARRAVDTAVPAQRLARLFPARQAVAQVPRRLRQAPQVQARRMGLAVALVPARALRRMQAEAAAVILPLVLRHRVPPVVRAATLPAASALVQELNRSAEAEAGTQRAVRLVAQARARAEAVLSQVTRHQQIPVVVVVVAGARHRQGVQAGADCSTSLCRLFAALPCIQSPSATRLCIKAVLCINGAFS